MTALINALGEVLAAVLTAVGVVGPTRRRNAIRENLVLLAEIRDGEDFGRDSIAYEWLSNHILSQVAGFSGVDLRTSRRHPQWGAALFSVVVWIPLGWLTYYLVSRDHPWLALLPAFPGAMFFLVMFPLLFNKEEVIPQASNALDPAILGAALAEKGVAQSFLRSGTRTPGMQTTEEPGDLSSFIATEESRSADDLGIRLELLSFPAEELGLEALERLRGLSKWERADLLFFGNDEVRFRGTGVTPGFFIDPHPGLVEKGLIAPAEPPSTNGEGQSFMTLTELGRETVRMFTALGAAPDYVDAEELASLKVDPYYTGDD